MCKLYVEPRPPLLTCSQPLSVAMATLRGPIKLTFSHDTSPHCTRFSSVLKTVRRESAVRRCWPGDTALTMAQYVASTAGDPETETNKPQLTRLSNAWKNMFTFSLKTCFKMRINLIGKKANEADRSGDGLSTISAHVLNTRVQLTG